MYENHFVSVIIAAAGMSHRMGSKINKQFINLKNKPILAHTIEKFERCRFVDEIIVVAREEEIEYCKKEIIKKYKFNKISKVVRGGKERQDSVYNGILALDEKAGIVLSHDGARPFIKIKDIVSGIKGAAKYGACVIGVPVKDTIKVVADDNNIENTPKRSLLWIAQTPQCFKKEIILEGYKKAISDDYLATDDSALVERIGVEVKMIMGSYDNIKITTPEDLAVGELFLENKSIIFDNRKFILQSR
ncbi:2-C-methyl-D-erythritol 4-phosphate cytidylyltransferase [Tepidimicrobium xylanilyticum]|uniref:2-C-methyl-D-erythritol 4-phosphate cytidylyltransferase n=1 Tax=Tepidimicrobium xylanilyticum TaxID=1123352 RepID=A0A1H3D4H8_9FIRM|nr:2-C-methyl-D-erythritol 4-phosphate cytidylyltransferase [Tepidimicrobium xylanilyticum]GMG97898.1 2-C-methyl-D-erythritol 4-phosphate cytidylyltransferase [Tepidimicrobium xylanilyticum]SDX61028.1 2-C-methyl-D-erythritol 4-phosphate cytidylyltransferase [Tepidimicrobium xylanilyticum]